MTGFDHFEPGDWADETDDAWNLDPSALRLDARPQVAIDYNRLMPQAHDGTTADAPQIPTRPIARDLHWVLLAPTAHGRRLLTKADVASSSETFDQLVERAMEAFSLGLLERWASLDDMVFLPVVDRGSGACRVLHRRGTQELPFPGSAVVFLPSTSTAIVAPAANRGAVARAAELARFFSDPSQPLSLNPLVGRDGRWRPFTPPKDHPAYDACAHLAILQKHAEITYQGQVLSQILDEELSVSPAQLVETDTASLTVCPWIDRSPTLLPETDLVAFISSTGTSTFFTPWAAVEVICGELLLRTHHHPVRYLAHDYPSVEQLRELERARLRLR